MKEERKKRERERKERRRRFFAGVLEPVSSNCS
jgi:hypothetical protein